MQGKRTSNEIQAWLHLQPWFADFMNAVLDRFGPSLEGFAKAMSFVAGREGERTLSEAFDWSQAKGGAALWSVRALEFNRWYNGGAQ